MLNKEHFMSMLTRESITGKNRGFVKKDGMLRTYDQERIDLS